MTVEELKDKIEEYDDDADLTFVYDKDKSVLHIHKIGHTVRVDDFTTETVLEVVFIMG